MKKDEIKLLKKSLDNDQLEDIFVIFTAHNTDEIHVACEMNMVDLMTHLMRLAKASEEINAIISTVAKMTGKPKKKFKNLN